MRNLEKKRERNRIWAAAWRKANPEKARSRVKAWRKANPERTRILSKIYYEANREEKRASNKAYHKAYHERNRTTIATRHKMWREANLQKITAIIKTWRQVNRQRVIVNKRAWDDANQVHIKAWRKSYRKRNPDKIQAWQRANNDKRRIQLYRVPFVQITTAMEEEMYTAQKGRCYYCGEDLNDIYDLEHRIPLSRGGHHIPENLVLACDTCNSRKWKLTDLEFFAKMALGGSNDDRIEPIRDSTLPEKGCFSQEIVGALQASDGLSAAATFKP